jgi:hypothetical protein
LKENDLIAVRNQNWMNRLDGWIRKEPNKRFFFAFGTSKFNTAINGKI